MNHKEKRIVATYIGLLLLISLVIWLFFKSRKKMSQEKNIEKANSSYQLEELKFFGAPLDSTKAYINIIIALAYDWNDLQSEREIIAKKEKINSFIQSYLSEKSYYELDEAQERRKLKKELLKRINLSMEKQIKDIYYIKFFVLKQDL